jgi:hypothetical protein
MIQKIFSMNTQSYFISAFVFIYSITASAQQMIKYDLRFLAENHKLEVFNREIKTADSSKSAVFLTAKENDGVAWIEGLLFSNGNIELDIKGKDMLQQSFVGVAFHGINDTTFDVVYFRPFNFQTTDPVRKIHAVQYVSLPKYDWQKLRNEQNGKYEKTIAPAPNPNEWFHAKIEIVFPVVKVYVNGSTEPSLVVEQLNATKSGKLGLWVGNNSDGNFANLTIQKK